MEKEGDDMEEFKDRLKKFRKQKNLTQKSLGEMVGASEVMIGQYERGLRNPKVEMISKLASALSIQITDLMDWNELYPNIAKDVEKHNHFAMYMKSLGFDVVYNTEPSMIPMEDVPEQFREDLEGDFIEGETFTITVMYEGEPLILSEEDFNELQKSTSECIEHQLWKIKKNQEK